MSAPNPPPPPAPSAAKSPVKGLKRPPVRRPKANPLLKPKPPAPKPQCPRPPKRNGPLAVADAAEKAHALQQAKADDEKLKQVHALRALPGHNGWSEKAPPGASYFPLVTTKRAFMEGMRHHIMRLSTEKSKNVDVTDQDQFPRPVMLYRRDPRAPPANQPGEQPRDEEPQSLSPEELAEADRVVRQKAERDAQRAANKALIASVDSTDEPSKNKASAGNTNSNMSKKEKATSFYGKNSVAQKKQAEIKYEETLPWHLESAERDAGVWVGTYVQGLSEMHCAFVIDGDKFRMVPLERYYKFTEKPRFNTFSLEAAENMMKKTGNLKRWIMHQDEEIEKLRKETRQFLGGRARVKMESSTSRAAPKAERMDDNDLDFDGNDEFQDDDDVVNPFAVDADMDEAEAKERLRRNHLGANLFGEGDDEEVEKQQKEEAMEKRQRKMMGKKTRKDLKKIEHAMDYESDSSDEENNPFRESSAESDEDEEEKKKEEERRKEEEKKKEEEEKKRKEEGGQEADASKQGESQDHAGDNKKPTTAPAAAKKIEGTKVVNRLKRATSPIYSDTSDSEMARKRPKTNQAGTIPSLAPSSRSGTPLPGRPAKTSGLGGAASDGEGTGGEGSDGGNNKLNKMKTKPKLMVTGTNGTPSGSRAGSPIPPGNQSISPAKGEGKRASMAIHTPRGSPPPSSAAGGSNISPEKSGAPVERIQLADVQKYITGDGISLMELMRTFAHRVGRPGGTTKPEFFTMLKANYEFGDDKKLRPKKKAAAAAAAAGGSGVGGGEASTAA